MDISFELGWPESRWVQDNVLQFYRPEDFLDGKGDGLEVFNASGQSLKHVRIETGAKILAFDIEPGSRVLLNVPRAKGDYCSMWVEAELGEVLLRTSESQTKNSGNCSFRRLVVREDGIETTYRRSDRDQIADSPETSHLNLQDGRRFANIGNLLIGSRSQD